MIIFSDLHLQLKTMDVCDRVLSAIGDKAAELGTNVVFCGDFYMVRYQVDVRLQNLVKSHMDDWRERGIQLDMVPGNHDQVDLDGENALQVFEAYDNVRVWTEPGTLGELGFVPYRKHNVMEAVRQVAAEKPAVIFAHLPVHGSLMNNGHKCDMGEAIPEDLPPLILGHYHKRQVSAIITPFGLPAWQYVGSPYQTSYGETGNVCGYLNWTRGSTDLLTFEPLDVGAPQHFMMEWDPAQQGEPPTRPGGAGDNVWLKIKASRSMIVEGKFRGVLKQHGLEDARVSVDPLPVDREHRFEVPPGEELLKSAERFVDERFRAMRAVDPAAMDDGVAQSDAAEMMTALHRWSAQ